MDSTCTSLPYCTEGISQQYAYCYYTSMHVVGYLHSQGPCAYAAMAQQLHQRVQLGVLQVRVPLGLG